MKKYQKTYLEYFGYSVSDFIPSEISGKKANDIHHIECKGMGGSKQKDNIENLIALTRDEHEEFGDKQQYKEYLKTVHLKFMERNKAA